ncbi:MAG: RNA pyrophosphohydrolase [Pseudomonadota bacterium]
MNERPDRIAMPYRPCVGAVVLNAQGRVWAGRRIQNSETPATHRWQFPQGGIDQGEDPLPAAKRELFEETGIKSVQLLAECSEWLKYDLPDDMLGIALKGKFRGQTQKWFAFLFEGEEDEINIDEPPDGSHPEFDAWDWKHLEEMPDLIVPFKRPIYDRLVDEFLSETRR